MKEYKMKKSLVVLALALALGTGSAAQAQPGLIWSRRRSMMAGCRRWS